MPIVTIYVQRTFQYNVEIILDYQNEVAVNSCSIHIPAIMIMGCMLLGTTWEDTETYPMMSVFSDTWKKRVRLTGKDISNNIRIQVRWLLAWSYESQSEISKSSTC